MCVCYPRNMNGEKGRYEERMKHIIAEIMMAREMELCLMRDIILGLLRREENNE